MTPVDQVIIDDHRGDCLRASVASVLDLATDAVPNFTDVEHWDGAFNDWLASRGLAALEICFPDPDVVSRTYFDVPGRFCILTGTSPRQRADGGAKAHAVVGLVQGWGIKIVHDPHPSRAGLADTGRRWVRFIIPAGHTTGSQ